MFCSVLLRLVVFRLVLFCSAWPCFITFCLVLFGSAAPSPARMLPRPPQRKFRHDMRSFERMRVYPRQGARVSEFAQGCKRAWARSPMNAHARVCAQRARRANTKQIFVAWRRPPGLVPMQRHNSPRHPITYLTRRLCPNTAAACANARAPPRNRSRCELR